MHKKVRTTDGHLEVLSMISELTLIENNSEPYVVMHYYILNDLVHCIGAVGILRSWDQ